MKADALQALRRRYVHSPANAATDFWQAPEEYLEPFQLAALQHLLETAGGAEWHMGVVTVRAAWVQEHAAVAVVGGGHVLVLSRKRCLDQSLDAVRFERVGKSRAGTWVQIRGSHPDLPIELLLPAPLAAHLGLALSPRPSGHSPYGWSDEDGDLSRDR